MEQTERLVETYLATQRTEEIQSIVRREHACFYLYRYWRAKKGSHRQRLGDSASPRQGARKLSHL
jgi:hypothetical protein